MRLAPWPTPLPRPYPTTARWNWKASKSTRSCSAYCATTPTSTAPTPAGSPTRSMAKMRSIAPAWRAITAPPDALPPTGPAVATAISRFSPWSNTTARNATPTVCPRAAGTPARAIRSGKACSTPSPIRCKASRCGWRRCRYPSWSTAPSMALSAPITT
ncbi:hypothetical protein D3C80_1446170 [compost metagenome]